MKCNPIEEFTILHSKKKFKYLNPNPGMVLIEDIAHALANLCRFTGHTREFFSVAQHSVLVSKFVVTKENELWGLLHDAPEAYVNDLASPLKSIIGGRYCSIHNHIMKIICTKFGLPLQEPEEVRAIDLIVTVNELWDLIDESYVEDGVPRIFYNINPWPPNLAKEKFLERFKELRG